MYCNRVSSQHSALKRPLLICLAARDSVRDMGTALEQHIAERDAEDARRRSLRAEMKQEMLHPPFNESDALAVVQALSRGMRIRAIGDSGLFPPYWVINDWRTRYPEFDEACVRASEAAADDLMAETIEIADDQKRAPACREVSIRARHAAVKVLNRKKYDPATRVEIAGNVRSADDLSDDALAAIVRARSRRDAVDAVPVDTGLPSDAE